MTSAVLKELRRELRVRQKLYPRWVDSGNLEQSVADHRIAMMEEAIVLIESQQPQQQSLFEEQP